MSSGRLRSSPRNGGASPAADTTVPSSFSSSFASSSVFSSAATTTSRPRRSASSTSPSFSSSSSKKRRYHEIVNRCRNPFCGAVLENKKQRYCDGASLCQLHRGVMLSFAWPNAPQGARGDHDRGNDRHRIDSTVGMELPASASGLTTMSTSAFSAPPQRSSTHAVAPQSRDGSGAEKRLGGWDASPSPSPLPSPSASATASTTRIAMEENEHNRNKRIKLTTASTTVQQLKAMPLGAMALNGSGSWNNVGGSGGRYVQSGNRVLSSSSTTTGSSSNTAGTAPTAPPAAPPRTPAPSTTEQAVEKTFGLLETPVALPSRGLSRANSLPVTTTNRNRDPRVRVTPGASIGNSGSGAVDTTGGVKRISPADYFNRLRQATETDAATTTTQETLLSAHHSHRSLAKESPDAATSRSSVTGASSGGARGDVDGPSHQPLRRAQSDTTVPTSTSTSTSSDPRKRSDRSSPLSSYASRSSRDDRSSHHAHDRSPLVRTSSSTSTASSSTTRRAETSHRNRSSLTTSSSMSRAERLFRSLLQPQFTYHDCLTKLVLTRVASFVPRTLSALRTSTTTTTTPPRTLEFYRELCKLVERDCGFKAKIVVNENSGGDCSSVARVTIAGREWLVASAATSSSSSSTATTIDLYHEILEKLLTESELWYEMITQIKKIHENEAMHRNRGAIGGVTFLKMWSSVKKRQLNHAMDVDLQSTFTRTRKRSHWSFAVGNVEIGSGSAVGKIDAFKHATASAFSFLHGMTILDDAEKPKFAATHVDKSTPTSSSTTSTRTSTTRSKKSPRSSGDAGSSSRSRHDSSTSTTNESRHAAVSSSSSSSSAAAAEFPRTSHGSSERAMSRSTTASSARASNATASGAVAAQHHGQAKGRTPSRSATIPSATSAPTPVPMPAPLPLPLSMRRAAVPAPVSIPPPVVGQTRPAATVRVPVQVPVASPSCRFCAGMQAKKPGAKCLKCLRAPPSASASASASVSAATASTGPTRGPAAVTSATGVPAKTLLNSIATPAAASSSFSSSSSANRTIAALHSFLRQSGSASLAAPTATSGSSSTTPNGPHSTATSSRTIGQPQPPNKR